MDEKERIEALEAELTKLKAHLRITLEILANYGVWGGDEINFWAADAVSKLLLLAKELREGAKDE